MDGGGSSIDKDIILIAERVERDALRLRETAGSCSGCCILSIICDIGSRCPVDRIEFVRGRSSRRRRVSR